MTEATLVQANISNGGMPKRPVPEAQVTPTGLAGDRSAHMRHRRVPDRAICIFSEELYLGLKGEHGIHLPWGSLGENFTTAGLDLSALAVGDRLEVGQCVIEITDVRTPCSQLKMWHRDLPRLIEGNSGWMARVLIEGMVRRGDPIRFLQREHERVTRPEDQ